MSSFDAGDAALIEQLFADGMTLSQVCSKWAVKPSVMREYCKDNGLSIPRDHARARELRRKTETGEHLSPVVQHIVDMHSTHSCEKIAKIVRRSESFVRRMIEVHIKKDTKSYHSQRYSMVKKLSEDKAISINEACVMTGISQSAYAYSARVIGVYRKKPGN